VTTRLFENAYMVLWYLTMLDFTQSAYAPGFALASVVLFAVAVGARKLRLEHA
jgi:hypothetical protein